MLPLKGRVFKIEISKVSGSALAAEICTGPHNRLLRRQHCSSLCSQSEGHEHVANMTSALGHDFVGFSARAWPPQYSPPSLCEQSELQCFAPGLRQMSARCLLQLCCTCYVIWLKIAQRFFCILTPNLGGFSFRALSYENKAERQREWRENVNAPPNLTAFCRIL